MKTTKEIEAHFLPFIDEVTKDNNARIMQYSKAMVIAETLADLEQLEREDATETEKLEYLQGYIEYLHSPYLYGAARKTRKNRIQRAFDAYGIFGVQEIIKFATQEA